MIRGRFILVHSDSSGMALAQYTGTKPMKCIIQVSKYFIVFRSISCEKVLSWFKVLGIMLPSKMVTRRNFHVSGIPDRRYFGRHSNSELLQYDGTHDLPALLAVPVAVVSIHMY